MNNFFNSGIFSISADISGFLALILSISIIIANYIKSRTTFDFTIVDYADFGGTTRFLLLIKNKSSTPLTISKITFDEIVCELEPKKIRGVPDTWNGVTTPRFPVRISPRDAELFYVEFLTSRSTRLECGMHLNFQIHTIDLQVSKTVLLGNRSHYLNKKV